MDRGPRRRHEVAAAVAATIADAGLSPGAATADVVAALHSWMDADLKATPLKTLQGQIWAAGFAAGELAAHVFADVAPQLRAWHAAGSPRGLLVGVGRQPASVVRGTPMPEI